MEDLKLRTRDYALSIIDLFRILPKTTEATVPGKQLLRSGTSIGANYREAQRSRSTLEFISKTNICLQELEESFYWLEILTESGIVPKIKVDKLYKETKELIAIFVTIIKNANRNKSV
jgi:four helix bundle protein